MLLKYHFTTKVTLLLLLTCIPTLLLAQTAKITDVVAEWTAKEGNHDGLRLYIDFSIYGNLTSKGQLALYFYHEDGSKVPANIDTYTTSNGHLVTSTGAVPPV